MRPLWKTLHVGSQGTRLSDWNRKSSVPTISYDQCQHPPHQLHSVSNGRHWSIACAACHGRWEADELAKDLVRAEKIRYQKGVPLQHHQASAAATSQVGPVITCAPSLAETLVKEATDTEEAAVRLQMTTACFRNWVSLCRLVAFLAKNQCAHDRLNMSCMALREAIPLR